MSLTCAAVDLGATSGRVSVGHYKGGRLAVTEVHRFPNQFDSLGESFYWDIPRLWGEVRKGLALARQAFPKLASVGVDTWGVDHALLDAAGQLVYPVHAYRDPRTQPGLRRLAKKGMAPVYAATGIPNLFYNTSLQLEAALERHPTLAKAAGRCLLLPDYFNFLLSGKATNEISIASTTQLLDLEGRQWSEAALKRFRIPRRWFTPPILAGKRLGTVQGHEELKGVNVIAVPGHDTAAAFDAMPADAAGDDIFLSSGTWSIVGFESETPLAGPEALKAGIANGRSGDGRYTPLRNVIGLWLLEQTLRDFAQRPRDAKEWDALIGAAEHLPQPKHLLDVTDPAFANPVSMRSAILKQLARAKVPQPTKLPEFVRLICDSLGAGHADVINRFQELSGRTFKRVLMVGGGSRNRLLCQATADAAGVPVVSFELEGSTVGNLASQLISQGEVKDLAHFRRRFSRQLTQQVFNPRRG